MHALCADILTSLAACMMAMTGVPPRVPTTPLRVRELRAYVNRYSWQLTVLCMHGLCPDLLTSNMH
jgi:hypothetical protein